MVLSLKRLGFHGLQVRASTLSPHTYKPIHRHLYPLPPMVATCCSGYHGALPRCPRKLENPSPGCCKRGHECFTLALFRRGFPPPQPQPGMHCSQDGVREWTTLRYNSHPYAPSQIRLKVMLTEALLSFFSPCPAPTAPLPNTPLLLQAPLFKAQESLSHSLLLEVPRPNAS